MKSLVVTLLTIPSLFAQGPLAPLAAPGPLMKSLDQIEPRTPITTLPVTLSTPGSYYFTKNLQFTATSGSAITILGKDVTLDLGGFTLSSTAAVTGRAIDVGSVHGLCIKNGNIAGNTTVAITGTAPARTWTPTPAGFEFGIIDFGTGSHYHDLGIRGCRSNGLFVTGGANAVIQRVTVSSNGGSGILSEFSSISHCTATGNIGSGIHAFSGSVSNSTASSNSGSGINAPYGSVSNSTGSFNGAFGIYAQYGSVANANARLNATTGIFAEYGSVTNSNATANVTYGIHANSGSVTHSTALTNTGTDLVALSAVVAFCKAGTTSISGSLTGNLSP